MKILNQLSRNFVSPIALTVVMLWHPAIASDTIGNTAVALGDAVFQPLGTGPIQMAVLRGNPQSGPSSVYLRFPPNFPGAMHLHTHAYHALVISGASKHWLDGQQEADATLQKPGDYWYQAGGQAHQDSFPTDEPTVLYVQFEGPMDVTQVE